MKTVSVARVFCVALLLPLAGYTADKAPSGQVERGKYLVTLAGCSDCHSPGGFMGKTDPKTYLAGSEVGFEIPGLGTFAGPNLTPDAETGLGKWTSEQIITALTRGVRPDGRVLAPAMPWPALSKLTPEDAKAIVVFLQSIPAVKNKVAGPFKPNETPTTFVYRIVPPPASKK